MKTIVSITPLPILADSRTYKMAFSFSRFGYRSYVVEGSVSKFESKKLPFELISVQGMVPFIQKNDTNEIRKGFNRSFFELLWNLYVRLTKPILNQLRTFLSLPKASLYYLHSFYQFPAVFLKSKLTRTPYIYDAHDFYPDENLGALNNWLEKQCIKHAATVVTVSNGVAQLMNKEFGCVPSVIRNCHDIRLDSDVEFCLRKKINLTPDDFLIVVVGQAKEGMPVTEAIEAIRRLPSNVHLAFVGKNSQQYFDLVEKANLISRVHLIPPVMPDQVVPFISDADASLILYYSHSPDYEHSLPNKFFQSISAQLPLLYPDLQEISQIAVNYQIGILVDMQSVDQIVSGVLQIMQKETAQNNYKLNLSKASQELSWEREEKILKDLAEEVFHFISGKQR